MITISLGIRGLLFLLYLIIEFLFIRYQKRSFLLSLIPYIIMIRKVNKALPFGWKAYKTFYYFFYVYRKNGNYTVMVEAKSELIQGVTYHEFPHFNFSGRILRDEVPDGLSSLVHYCERENSRYPDLVKRETRDQKLKDLGI